MNNRQRAEMLIERLNVLTLGKRQAEIQWNTPKAFMLESYRPGSRRIYQICRNSDVSPHHEGIGSSTYFSGTAVEVCNYLRAMLEGMALAGELRL
jgi:hypothetical protein